MTIKLILAPLDGSAQSINALDTAHVVAARFGAHIKAIHVRQRLHEQYLFSNVPSSLKKNFAELASQATDQTVSQIRAQFEEFCGRLNVRKTNDVIADDGVSASLHIVDGSPVDTLIHESRLVDVVTIARPAGKGGGLAVGERLESILMNSGRPVLIVPPDWHSHRAEHAAIGWNDSAEASRALQMTLPWLSQMQRISIICSDKRRASADRVVDYLGLHGCSAQVVSLDKQSGKSVGERMVALCSKIEAEFLVVGGFSHTRSRQRLFGGVTSHLLSNTKVITVMVH
jgi:nucleotide-binding universal stress UspA family protein